MKRLFFLGALSLAALLTACSPSDPRCAHLPNGVNYCLQTTEGIAPFEIQQKIDVTFNGRNETMIAQLEVDAAGMRVALLTLLGQSLLQARFVHGEVHAEGLALQKLDPAFLLSMIQLVYWEAGSLQKGFSDFVELVENEEERIFLKEGEILLRIGYTRGRSPTGDIRIELPGMSVEFRMATLAAEPGPPT